MHHDRNIPRLDGWLAAHGKRGSFHRNFHGENWKSTLLVESRGGLDCYESLASALVDKARNDFLGGLFSREVSIRGTFEESMASHARQRTAAAGTAGSANVQGSVRNSSLKLSRVKRVRGRRGSVRDSSRCCRAVRVFARLGAALKPKRGQELGFAALFAILGLKRIPSDDQQKARKAFEYGCKLCIAHGSQTVTPHFNQRQ